RVVEAGEQHLAAEPDLLMTLPRCRTRLGEAADEEDAAVTDDDGAIDGLGMLERADPMMGVDDSDTAHTARVSPKELQNSHPRSLLSCSVGASQHLKGPSRPGSQ